MPNIGLNHLGRFGFMAVLVLIATIVIPSPQSLISLVTEPKSQDMESKLTETALLLPSIFTPQKAYATTTTLNSVSCTTQLGGTWFAPTSTCTIGVIDTSGIADYTITDGNELFIPIGTTLSIPSLGSGVLVGIDNGGNLTNWGTISIAVSDPNDYGILNYGLDNSVINNYGRILIKNTNGTGIFNGYGFAPVGQATIKNFPKAKILVSNSGGTGILFLLDRYTTGKISNYPGGNLTVNNSGPSIGIGLGNSTYSDGRINNSGNFTNKEVVFDNGIIFNNNTGTLTNSGTITLPSGGFGYYDNEGTTNNSGTINNGGTITNSLAIYNSGTIFNCPGTYTGNPPIGNPLVLCFTTTTSITPIVPLVSLGGSIIIGGIVTDSNLTKITPTGTLTWDDGGAGGTFTVNKQPTNTCTLSGTTNTSSCKITYTPPSSATVGTKITIKTSYSGDTTHQTSYKISTLTVLRGTMTAIFPAKASITHGTNQVYTATVTDTSSGKMSAPAGTVSWKASAPGGSFSSGTCTLTPVSSSQSKCSVTYTSPLKPITETITGSYTNSDGIHINSSGKATLTVT